MPRETGREEKELNYIDQEMFQCPVYRVSLVRERDGPNYLVNTAKLAAHLFWKYLGDSDREVFAIAMLDVRLRLIGMQTISIGTLSGSMVSARETVKGPLLANAGNLVVGHVHPSGSILPSPEDNRVTQKLVEVGRLLDMPVQDHIIVNGEGQYYSYAESGKLNRCQKRR